MNVGRIEWESAARILGWVIALGLFVGVIIRIGFAALASLGPVLRRLASDDYARGGLVMAALLGLGGLGLASQLLQIGTLPFLTSPELCDCGLREHEIMAREAIINATFGVQLWLVVGALVLAVPGLWFPGSLGADAGMPPA